MDRTPPTVAEASAAVEPAQAPKPARRAPARKRTAAKPAADQAPATETTTAPTESVPPAEPASAETSSPEPASAPAAVADVVPVAGFTDDQHRMLDAKGVPDDRGGRALLYREWKRTGLDPLAGHLYLRQDFVTVNVKNDIGNWVERKIPVYSVGTKIAGFRTVATNQDTYRGQTPPQWWDGKAWWDVWAFDRAPLACRVGVLVDGYAAPMWGIAVYEEFKPANAGIRSAWVKMRSHMVRIAAESMAIRMAYPDLLSDIYGDEELVQARADMENAAVTGSPVTAFAFGEHTDRPTEAPQDNAPAPAPMPAVEASSGSPAVDGLMAAAKAAEALAYLRDHPGQFDSVYERAGRMGLLYVNLADEGGATLKDAMAAFWCAHVADMAEFQPGAIPDIRATAKRRRLLSTPVPGDDRTLRDFLDALETPSPADDGPPPVEPDDAGEPEPPEGDSWHIPGRAADRHGPDAPPPVEKCALCPEMINPRSPATYVEGERVCQACANTALAVGPPPF